MLVPVWDCIILFNNAPYEYLAGTRDPLALFILCGCTLVMYCLIIVFFFRCANVENRTEQTLLTIGFFFVSMLAVGLMIVSLPYKDFSDRLNEEIYTNCGRGTLTTPLKGQWDKLHALRSEPHCAQQPSVEDC